MPTKSIFLSGLRTHPEKSPQIKLKCKCASPSWDEIGYANVSSIIRPSFPLLHHPPFILILFLFIPPHTIIHPSFHFSGQMKVILHRPSRQDGLWLDSRSIYFSRDDSTERKFHLVVKNKPAAPWSNRPFSHQNKRTNQKKKKISPPEGCLLAAGTETWSRRSFFVSSNPQCPNRPSKGNQL